VADVGKRTRSSVTFTVLAVSVGSYALLQSLVVPVLPTIQGELHTSQNAVTWVLTAYLLSASICTPIVGRLGDMHGKERWFVITLVFIALGSVLAALSTSIGVMIVARVIQGVGGGALPLAFGIIRDEFPREKVAGAVGTLAALLAAGSGLGVVLAGPIVSALSWHWLFWFPGAIVAVCAVVAHFVIPESPVRSPGVLSWGGAALMSTWLLALLLAISEAPTWGWSSLRVVGLLVVAVVVAVTWVVVESRSKSPLIDMHMMRLPAVWTTNLVAFLISIGMFATFAFLPQFVQTPSSNGYGFGATVTQSGLILLPATIAMFALGVVSGRLSARFGAKSVLVAGVSVSVLTFAVLTFAHETVYGVLVAMVLQGIGFGLAFAAMANLIVVSVPPEQTGVASGMNANIRTIGGSIGAAVMSSIVTSQLHPNGVPLESGYTRGFAMITLATLVAAFVAMLVPSVPRGPAPTDAEHAPHAELAIMPGGTLAGDEYE
jgi:EmrB/QacA subfamily drug resistance transporter